MRLQSLLKKLAALKFKIQKAAKYDEHNVADKIRGPRANDVMLREKRNFDKILRTENDLLEADLNGRATLKVGALNFAAKALNAAGNLLSLSIIKTAVTASAVNEVQVIDFSTTPDAGSWSINFDGQITSSIPYTANAAAVQSALNALSNLSGVTVSGSYSSDFTVTFAGADGGVDQPLMTVATNTLTASSSPVSIGIVEDTAGAPASDTREVVVVGNEVEIYCLSAATNAQVKAQLEASPTASSLMSVTIDAGQGSASATAVSNAEFKGGA